MPVSKGEDVFDPFKVKIDDIGDRDIQHWLDISTNKFGFVLMTSGYATFGLFECDR